MDGDLTAATGARAMAVTVLDAAIVHGVANGSEA
jgi:hypothetical protein